MKQKQMLLLFAFAILMALAASSCQEKQSETPWQYYGEASPETAKTAKAVTP